MSDYEETQIWEGLRKHLDALGLSERKQATAPYARTEARGRWQVSSAVLAVALIVVVVSVSLARRNGEAVVGSASDGTFVLEIRSAHAIYEAGAPIEISASLTYQGEEPSVHIAHGLPLLGFGVREPVFGNRLSPLVEAVRAGSTLERGVPLVATFAKSGGYLNEPDPSFVAYLEDPTFWLPAGTWEVYVTSTFQAQDGAPRTNLSATVTVQVVQESR